MMAFVNELAEIAISPISTIMMVEYGFVKPKMA